MTTRPALSGAGACCLIQQPLALRELLFGPHKAVSCVVRVSVVSRNRPRRVNAAGGGALEKTCPGPRSIKRCDDAVGGAQEAMNPEARVNESSRDRAPLIESCREDELRRRNIKRGEGPALAAQEAVPRAVGALLVSRDRSVRVDGYRRDGKRVWRINVGGDGAVSSAQEAVRYEESRGAQLG